MLETAETNVVRSASEREAPLSFMLLLTFIPTNITMKNPKRKKRNFVRDEDPRPVFRLANGPFFMTAMID